MHSGDQVPEPKYEPVGSPHPENFRPDALFSENTAGVSVFNNAISMLLGNDISSTWSNMPHAYEMLEFK
jgi:transcription factor MYB, plant